MLIIIPYNSSDREQGAHAELVRLLVGLLDVIELHHNLKSLVASNNKILLSCQ